MTNKWLPGTEEPKNCFVQVNDSISVMTVASTDVADYQGLHHGDSLQTCDSRNQNVTLQNVCKHQIRREFPVNLWRRMFLI